MADDHLDPPPSTVRRLPKELVAEAARAKPTDPPPVEPRALHLPLGQPSPKVDLTAGGAVWFRFFAPTRGRYAAETAGELGLTMALYGPGSPSKFVAVDADGRGHGFNAKIEMSLPGGTYWLKVEGMTRITAGTFRVMVAQI